MPVSIRIPGVLIDTLYPHSDFSELTDVEIKHVKSSAKQLIERAITESLEPASVRLDSEIDFVGHLTINILNKYNRAIIKHARQSKSAEAVIALGYLMSALNHDWHMSMIETKGTGLKPYLDCLNYDARYEQETFFSFVDDALTQKRIGIVEASTGVGKTLAILAQANERALTEEKLCAISTNSLANLSQYIEDYNSLVNHNKTMAPLYLIVGRQNFVSSERLREWISSEKCTVDTANIEHWLARGGRNDDEPEFIPSMTLDSLKKTEPGAIDSEVALTLYATDEDLGSVAYRAQFSDAMSTTKGIILVTHAMLCVDIKIRRMRHGMDDEVLSDLKSMQKEVKKRLNDYKQAEDEKEKDSAFEKYTELSKAYTEFRMAAMQESGSSLLPNYHYLFVDEAHLLDGAMTSTTSETISLRSIIRDANTHAEKGLLPKWRIKDANSVISELIKYQETTNSEQVMLSKRTERENHLLLKLCEVLLGSRVAKFDIGESWLNQVKQLRLGLSRIHKSNFTCILSYSPIRQYPQINTGEINTLAYFKDMWARTEGVAIISATLYIKRYNAYSANYIASLLAISKERRSEYPPVVAQWTRNIVKSVLLPPAGREDSDKLMPVGRVFKGSLEERTAIKSDWEYTIAKYIVDIYKNAAGGTMALMTAYEDCMNVYTIIEALSPGIKIVLADGITTLDEQKAKFIESSKKGERPLWLTLGNAWVGLDINGKSIGLNADEIHEKDNVITDLVIVKIPFGTNASMSHMVRMLKMENRTSDIELMETIMRLKQGLGRLVRLEQQQNNRHIHILDGRLNHPKYKGYLSLVRALVDTYPKTEYRKALDL